MNIEEKTEIERQIKYILRNNFSDIKSIENYIDSGKRFERCEIIEKARMYGKALGIIHSLYSEVVVLQETIRNMKKEEK